MNELAYAFCESITAGAFTPWHIRKLTKQGLKLGGGADTPALCGRVVSWDRKVSLTPEHLADCCQKCKAEYERGEKG